MTGTKAAPTLAGLTLLAALATGCTTGGEGSEEAASTEDYCASFTTFVSSLRSPESSDERGQLADTRSAMAGLAATGSPEGMPDDARAGFQTFADFFAGLEDDVTVSEMAGLSAEVDAADQADMETWRDYSYEACDVPAGDDG